MIPEVEGGRKDKKESGRGDEKDGCPYRNFEAIVLTPVIASMYDFIRLLGP